MLTPEATGKLIDGLLEQHKHGDELLRLPWQDTAINASVIKLPLDCVLLNPKSHRIRAQLESHAERELIEASPYSERAQELIADLLRQDEGFEDLKQNLAEYRQKDPGIITSEGLLVNANRRAVALRDLGEQYIRVAVLPKLALEDDIDRLELQLQVTRDYRQDYTYTNELLFVNELLEKHRLTPEQAALALGWAASRQPKELQDGRRRVEAAVRVLALIRGVQDLSGHSLPLMYFDEQKIALEEADRQYEALKGDDPDSAQRTLNVRLAGILAGVQYRDLRNVDSGFLETYLVPQMEETETIAEHVPQLLGVESTEDTAPLPPGLEFLDDKPAPQGSGDSEKLLEVVAQSIKADAVHLQANGQVVELPRKEFHDQLRDAYEAAAQDAKTDKVGANALSTPIESLKVANRKLKAARDGYLKVANETRFDRVQFQDVFEQVRRSVEAIRVELDQGEA